MPSQSSVGGKLIGRVLIPKVKVLLKSICDQIIFVNEFGHHFKHYGQFNIACFPNSEVQRFVISDRSWLRWRLNLALAWIFCWKNNRDLRDDEHCRLSLSATNITTLVLYYDEYFCQNLILLFNETKSRLCKSRVNRFYYELCMYVEWWWYFSFFLLWCTSY